MKWETVSDFIAFALVNPTKKDSWREDDYIESEFIDEDLIVFINESLQTGETLISVDLRESFNKVKQCPIHFTIPVSNRKTKRIREALKFLKKNEKIAGQFFGRMPGFDDLDSEKFYNFQ